MALIKNIELKNGVVTNYHRIVRISIYTNEEILIEVASYTSKSKREEEADAIKNNLPMNVFINTSYYSANYNEDMNIKKAYEYLKTLDEYKDAINEN